MTKVVSVMAQVFVLALVVVLVLVLVRALWMVLCVVLVQGQCIPRHGCVGAAPQAVGLRGIACARTT